MNIKRITIALALIGLLSSCAHKNLNTYTEQYSSYEHRLYVIDHGIHTGLVIETRHILPALGLQDSIYRQFRFVEIGRGDAGFYQEAEPGSATTLSALFLSTPAVMHMRGYNRFPFQRYPLSRSLEIRLSSSGLLALVDAVSGSFTRVEGVAVKVADGNNERSNFYQSNGSYHLFYTCNNWTAEMVELSGYPINHRWAFFADSVMKQIESVQRRLGLACRQVGGYRCDTPVE